MERKISNRKRKYQSYPAVKLARFGVHKDYARKGLGTFILNYIKMNFFNNNKTGCRFITVDAYNKAGVISFYAKNSFIKLVTESSQETVPLYYDLLNLKVK